MDPLENSSQHWDRLWKDWRTNLYPKIPLFHLGEDFIRYQLHFKAFDRLLGPISLFQKDILELGSGTGNNSLYFARAHKVKSVTLVDFSQGALDRVREKHFPCSLAKIKKDLFRFSPKQNYYFVHSTGLVEHFLEKNRLLVVKKHSQFTQPGGLVMIWVPVISPAFTLIQKFNRVLGIKEIPFTKEELQFYCQQAKLEIIAEGRAVFGALYGILAKKTN